MSKRTILILALAFLAHITTASAQTDSIPAGVTRQQDASISALGGSTAENNGIDTLGGSAAENDETSAPDDSLAVVTRPRPEPNILGMPVYYDTLGNVIGGDSPRSLEYRRPKHHYFNSLSDRYCGFFLEGETMLGPRDLAAGFNLTYLPRRWGAYTSVLFGFSDTYVALGPALRLSGYDSHLDWHLYGGLVWGGSHAGAEAGIRVALPQHHSDFSFTSASLGLGVINGDTYLTLGLSIEVLAISAFSILLW